MAEFLKNGKLHGEDLCVDEEFSAELRGTGKVLSNLCIACQLYCQRKEPNSCFDPLTGALDLQINHQRERYCSGSLR